VAPRLVLGLTVDIREFLEARLAEDEHDARAAGWHRWYVDEEDGAVRTVSHGDEVALPRRGYNAAHIVRHDPARVLRDVEAKRRVVARHHRGDRNECVGCGYFGDCDDPHVDEAPTAEGGRGQTCPELRDLAAPFADHPSYDPTWSPEATT